MEVREEESKEELMLLRVRILTETVSGWSRGSLDCSRPDRDGRVGDGQSGSDGRGRDQALNCYWLAGMARAAPNFRLRGATAGGSKPQGAWSAEAQWTSLNTQWTPPSKQKLTHTRSLDEKKLCESGGHGNRYESGWWLGYRWILLAAGGRGKRGEILHYQQCLLMSRIQSSKEEMKPRTCVVTINQKTKQ